MNNMYSTDYWKAVREDEFRRGDAMWTQAEATASGAAQGYAPIAPVVPKPAFSGMFQSLTGEWVAPDKLKHNNMQPYFRGTVKQNIDPNANSTLLESFTGRGDLLMKKQETESFFQPSNNAGNVCGMANNDSFYLDHIVAPTARNNDTPFEQIRVAPGIGLGYTSEGAGGFQQGATLDYMRPKNVDELRAASRPKVSYESRPTGAPKAINTARGLTGTFEQKKPDTFHEQSPEQWLKTTGAFTRESGRPVQTLKPTSRVETHTEHKGPATAGIRIGKGIAEDYGRSSITVSETERQTTQMRTVVSNVTSMVKAVVAPLLDILKRTPKEYMIDASRTYGNMAAQIPSKPTLYDPINHMMRTTIKETTIHDSTITNPRGHNEGRAENPEAPKVTVRETLPVQETQRNISSHTYRVVVYNPDAVAKTTIKETTISAVNPSGFVGGGVERRHGAYTHVAIQVPLTQKQFTSTVANVGIAGAKTEFRAVSSDAERAAEIDGTREMLNIAAGHVPGAGGAYTSTNPDTVDMISRKIVGDSMASRSVLNATRVVGQNVLPVNNSQITKQANALPNALENRLDPTMTMALKSNPYNLSINPIGA